MKRILPIVLYLLIYNTTAAQKPELSLVELVSYTNLPENKFSSSLARKGFKPESTEGTEENSGNLFKKVYKDRNIEKLISRYSVNDTAAILFQTTSASEFKELIEELKAEGFYYSNKGEDIDQHQIFQKANIIAKPIQKEEEGKTIYCLKVERKALPKPREIMFAEDLLQLTSHEYIAAVFGPDKVKKDQFFFSDKEVNKCSVLFPNTSMQVIFIWNDENNNKDISFIMIGGQLRSQSSISYYKPIELNKWQSAQGIFSGMSLRELCQRNGAALDIYGWETDQPGMIAPTNNGKINFKKLGVQLSCLDCNEDRYYTNNGIINSEKVLKENRRAYVSSIIVLP